MPISAKTRSQRGTNGLEETQSEGISKEKLTQTSSSETSDQSLEPEIIAPPAAVVADASGRAEDTPSPYSATDLRLATRMNREIASHLGLSGRSRSVKV